MVVKRQEWELDNTAIDVITITLFVIRKSIVKQKCSLPVPASTGSSIHGIVTKLDQRLPKRILVFYDICMKPVTG
jgi:hypothetical protein